MPAPDARPHCHACGYDLTGIDLTGRCPECGTRIDFRLPSKARHDAIFAWIFNALAAVTVVGVPFFGLVLAIFGIIIACARDPLRDMRPRAPTWHRLKRAAAVAGAIIAAVAIAMHAIDAIR